MANEHTNTVCSGCGATFKPGGIGMHVRLTPSCTPEMRFWGKIKRGDGCWLWQASVNTTGYGMACWEGRKNIVAHRLAYELLRGPIPAGLLALHKCDTPRCVNPDHLFFGTDADNAVDRSVKGRSGALLTRDQVLCIRKALAENPGRGINTKLQAQYGISAGVISSLKSGRTYRHIV